MAREVQHRRLWGVSPEGREGTVSSRTVCGRGGSDPEGCGERAFVVGRAAFGPEDGTHVRRARHQLEGGDRHSDADAFSRGTAADVLLEEGGAAKCSVLARRIAADLGRGAVVLMMASACGSRVRIAQRLAQHRGAGTSRKQEHDGQEGCSKHDHAHVGNGKTGATPQRSKSAVIVSSCCRPTGATRDLAGFSPGWPKIPRCSALRNRRQTRSSLHRLRARPTRRPSGAARTWFPSPA